MNLAASPQLFRYTYYAFFFNLDMKFIKKYNCRVWLSFLKGHMIVQSILIPKKKYTKDDAIMWIINNGYK
ncbi:hypothetical protein, partial [Saccharophagus degradans]